METLRRARILAGLDDAACLRNPRSSAAAEVMTVTTSTASTCASVADSDSEEDEDLVRATLERCGIAPLSLKPLSYIPPDVSDDEEDEFELLCAIKRRFAAYDSDTLVNSRENDLQKHQQVRAPSITSEKETSSNLLFVNKTNYCKGCPDSGDACNTTRNFELNEDNVPENQPSGYIEWHRSATNIPLKYSSFPKAAQAFIDAIKKNRSCQKLLRSKLIQIEAKLEANKKLRERVKILKNFQASCKRRTGRALSQKKDPLVQLISAPKVRASKNSKVNGKKVAAMCYGPAENTHVANYRMAMTSHPLKLSREHWSMEETDGLKKGIKQQLQQMSFQMSVDLCSGSEGSFEASIDLDAIMVSIAHFEITPEHMKLFLPKVNWEQLASMYVDGRSGVECEARWLNWENPLINRRCQWTNTEDRNILCIVKERGYYNWIDTASLLRTNRTPFQCLARFQRSLNTFILKSEWTDDEDAQLRKAVETFGEGNWQFIASALEGRTGTQCSNRWKKTLHPSRKRKGRWTKDEDKQLKVAVTLLGPKTWNNIAQFVPGRTDVQCRERWVNSLDSSLNWGKWTKEEDSRLREAITKFGYCWSKVAKCVPPRTDNQCRRRWMRQYPHEVPLLQAAKKITKVALISNFVDRESERPALGPNDFVPLPANDSISAPKDQISPAKQKKKSLRKPKVKETNKASLDALKRIRSKKSSEAKICPEEVVSITICDQAGSSGEGALSRKKRLTKPRSKMNRCTDPMQDSQLCSSATSLTITNDKVVEEISATGAVIAKKAAKAHSRKAKLAEAHVIGKDGFNLENVSIANPSSMGNKCTTPVQGHLSPCRDSALPMTSNDGDFEAFTGDNEVEKSGGDNAFEKNSVTMQMSTNDGDIEASIGGNATRKKLTPKRHPKRNKCDEVEKAGGDNAIAKKGSATKPRSTLPNHLPDVASNWDDSIPAIAGSSYVASSALEHLASNTIVNSPFESASSVHQEDRLESFCGNQSCSKQVHETADDHRTLASFIKYNVKRSRLNT